MTVNVTAAGVTHLAELDAASPLTNDFDALELGKGNTDIAALVTRDIALQKLMPPGIVQVTQGYPVLGDTDPANSGAAADFWTWAFRIDGASAGPLVASTGWLTNYASGAPALAEPVGFGFDDIVQLRSDQVLTVFLNAKTGSGGNVVLAYTEASAEMAMAATYSQRVSLASSYPLGVKTSSDRSTVRIAEGAAVFFMCRVLGESGVPITRSEVSTAQFRVWVRNPRTGRYNELQVSPPDTVETIIAPTPVTTDIRWPHPLGYNVAKWINFDMVSPGRDVRVELDLRTTLGRVAPYTWDVGIDSRAGRYGGV